MLTVVQHIRLTCLHQSFIHDIRFAAGEMNDVFCDGVRAVWREITTS